jgi:hypothetical protein
MPANGARVTDLDELGRENVFPTGRIGGHALSREKHRCSAHVALRRLRPKKIITKSVAKPIVSPSSITASSFINHAAVAYAFGLHRGHGYCTWVWL